MGVTIVSVLFSGVVAAFITFFLNRWSARVAGERQQSTLEDWERRKFEANQRLLSFRIFTESFYAVKNEIFYLGLDLKNTEAIFSGAGLATEQMLRLQNPHISVSDLEAQKNILLTQRRVDMVQRKISRLDQYNNAVKAIVVRAESEISVCSHYLSADLQDRIVALFNKLNRLTDVGTPADAAAKLAIYNDVELEFRQIQKALLGETNSFVKALAAKAAG